MSSKDKLASHCYGQIPRQLSHLDKNNLSIHYGCFDRDFWHYKKTSFPSAIRQMGCLNLALVYKNNHGHNPYVGKALIKELAKASLLYGIRLAKRDGSYDEWYLNERGWAGPSAYLLYAFSRTYQILESDLSEEEQKEIKKSLYNTAVFLASGSEGNYLANHTAKALCAISETGKIVDLPKNILARVRSDYLKNFNMNEGWGLEYDGLDIGYETASISFLARYIRNEDDIELRKCIERSTYLISHFCFPDYSFARSFGCRENSNFFPFGFAYFDNKYLIGFYMKSLELGQLPLPGDQDDHYLFYRLYEILETLDYLEDQYVCTSPLEYKDIHLEQAGVFTKTVNDLYFIWCYKNGGAFAVFDKKNKQCRLEFSPITVKVNNLLYSTRLNRNIEVFPEGNGLRARIGLLKVRRPYFNPIKKLFFDIITIASNSKTLSYYLKILIRKMLISPSKNTVGSVRYQIKFLETAIEVEADLELIAKSKGCYNITKRSLVRYVPQSGYFTNVDLNEVDEIIFKDNKFRMVLN